MKRFLAALGLLILTGGVFYSSLSLIPREVSASGMVCCNLSLDCSTGGAGPGYSCDKGGSTTCSDPGRPHMTGFCVKTCRPDMECDEEGGGW